MSKDTKGPDMDMARRIVALLNGALELDRPAVAALVANRAPCNEALADHPTIQVNAQHGGYFVGMLGVLNGACGVFPEGHARAGWGPIQAEFEEDGDAHFNRLARFVLTE